MTRSLLRTALLVLAGSALCGAACQSDNSLSRQFQKRLDENRRQVGREVTERKSQLGAFSEAMGFCTRERRNAYEMDAAEEYSVGRTVAARHLASLDAELLPADHPAALYVDHVGQVVAVAAELNGVDTAPDRVGDSRYVDNRPWPLAGYRFLVLRTDDVNAYGLPGGTVMISTGLLSRLESEDELAAVLAHEVAHVQRGHGVEVLKAFMCQHAGRSQASQQMKDFGSRVEKNLEQNLAGVGLKQSRDKDALAELLGAAANASLALFSHGYPDENELEADRMAVRHLVRAGYEARALRLALDRLEKAARPNETYAKTHPPFRERHDALGPVLAKLGPQELTRPEPEVAVRTQRFRDERARLKAPPAPPAQGG